MPKKKVSEDPTPVTVGEVEETLEETKVAPLTNDFGRQDLNELRDKVNEVIANL